MHTRTRLVTALVLGATAGPLNPAAGPVGPTIRTLAEIESRIAINATSTPGNADASPSVYNITGPGNGLIATNPWANFAY